ncbi:hypothetical protein EsHS_00002738 [Epichloe bromicola]
MLLKRLVPAMLALPALAESDVARILARISRGLGSLNGSLATYEGGAGDGLSRILGNSTALKKELDRGSEEASNAPALAFPDALGLAAGTAGLAHDTNSTRRRSHRRQARLRQAGRQLHCPLHRPRPAGVHQELWPHCCLEAAVGH